MWRSSAASRGWWRARRRRRRSESGEEACAEGSAGSGLGGERWETASGRTGSEGSSGMDAEVVGGSASSGASISDGSFLARRREAAIGGTEREG
nr:unnamed protein product [Digitaria exilis]